MVCPDEIYINTALTVFKIVYGIDNAGGVVQSALISCFNQFLNSVTPGLSVLPLSQER